MMKNLVLIVSITLNVFLVFRLITAQVTSVEPSRDNRSDRVSVLQTPVAGGTDQPMNVAGTEEPVLQRPEDQSNDYAQYLAHLRQQNLSDDEIKWILLARIDAQYKDLEQETEYQYWQAPSRDNLGTALEELVRDAEKRDLLLELFGDSVVDDPVFQELFKPLDRKLGFLSSDSQIALNDLIVKTRAETSSMFQGGFIRETRQDRLEAGENMLAAIQELLTPEEFNEYQLRESRTANMMRRSMDGYDYGEQEFRDIFEIRQSAELQPGQVGLNYRDPLVREEIRSSRERISDQVREYLGDDRYQELERVQDPLFRSLQAIGDRYGNSEREVVAAYDITRESREKLDEIRRNQSLSSEQSQSEIRTLNEQTLREIEEVVGEEAAQSIQSNAAQFRNRRPGRRGPR